MFKQLNTIQINNEKHSSSLFKILGNNAYLVEQDALFIVQTKKELVKTYPKTDLVIAKSSNCLLVGSSALGYDLICENGSIFFEQKLKGFKLPFDSQSEKIYFFRRDKKAKEYQSGLYNTHSRLFVLDTDSVLNINFIQDDIYLTSENIRIDDDGKDIWKLRLGQFDGVEVKDFLGICQNQLLIACSRHLLISVDVNTGNILRKWRDLPAFEEGQFYRGVLPEPTDFVLDEETGKLIGVFSKYYFEIDIQTGEIRYKDVREELKAYHINSFRRMGNNPFTKDHLFLIAHAELDERPNIDLDCVLAFNRNTKKVDWVHIFKDAGLGTNVPQITSTHLYQIDTKNNLYIFERISS